MKALGIDTSNYVTSVALVDEEGEVVKDLRTTLPVPKGERGLRQSEALFHHTRNLPILLEAALADGGSDLAAVVVSSRPRRVTGSYMPVFLSGSSQARTLAAALKIPWIERSHQEGHLFAALASCGSQFEPGQFLGVHLSGGTTELLKVTLSPMQPFLEVELLGGSSDLHAGQFIDRVGVALGLPFPAGPALEKLAEEGTGICRLSTSLDGLNPSFSGPATQALRLIEDGTPAAEVALAVQNAVVKMLEKWLTRAHEITGLNNVLLSGGVVANQYLRQRLPQRLRKRGTDLILNFAESRLSGDNAVGLAFSYWYPNLKQLRCQEKGGYYGQH